MSNNCALSFKKDKKGFCNTIVKGKLRIKETARIEKTLAVENNLEVYNDINTCNISIKNQLIYSSPELINDSGETLSQLKSLSFINTNGMGILEDGVKDGSYKKIIKIVDDTIIDGIWEEKTSLTASDGNIGDRFGSSVSINSDGSKAIIGAPNDDSSKGKVYIFGLSGDTWLEEAGLTASDGVNNDRFGYSISINSDGSKAIIGAPSIGSTNIGKAYIFGLSGGIWTEEAGFTASDGLIGDQFGWSVAMNANGTKAIVGARSYDSGKGKAYIYGLSGGIWTEEAGLTASDGGSNDQFGFSVSMNSDGTKVIICATYTSDGGKGYIFGLSGGVWTEEAGLTGSDASATGLFGDSFGHSVSMSNDGKKVIIGAINYDNPPNSDQGKAYIFGLSGGSWIEEAGITASDGDNMDRFATSVSINSDGKKAIVSSQNYSIPNLNQGKVYIYGISGDSWIEETGITISNGATSDQFGWSTSMNSDGYKVIIGTYGGEKAYIYGLSGFSNYTLEYNGGETTILTDKGDNACFVYSDVISEWIKI